MSEVLRTQIRTAAHHAARESLNAAAGAASEAAITQLLRVELTERLGRKITVLDHAPFQCVLHTSSGTPVLSRMEVDLLLLDENGTPLFGIELKVAIGSGAVKAAVRQTKKYVLQVKIPFALVVIGTEGDCTVDFF